MDIRSSWNGETKGMWWCCQLCTLGRWWTAAKWTGVVSVSRSRTVIDYNQHMCGVDRRDQLMAYYTTLCKTLKWYRKVVLQFLDMAVVNAYLLYTKLCGTKHRIWLHKQLICSLIAVDDRTKQLQLITSAFMHHKASDLSRSLSGQHYFDIIPATDAKSMPSRKCVVCRKRRQHKKTRYLCETCPSKPALCIVPCFRLSQLCWFWLQWKTGQWIYPFPSS